MLHHTQLRHIVLCYSMICYGMIYWIYCHDVVHWVAYISWHIGCTSWYVVMHCLFYWFAFVGFWSSCLYGCLKLWLYTIFENPGAQTSIHTWNTLPYNDRVMCCFAFQYYDVCFVTSVMLVYSNRAHCIALSDIVSRRVVSRRVISHAYMGERGRERERYGQSPY